MDESRRRRLYQGGYLLAFMLVAVPLLELGANAWPPVFSAARWRFGAAGYLGNNLLLPLVGACLALLLSTVLGHRRALKVFAALSVLGGFVLIGAASSITLDALELRRGVNEGLLRSFDIAAVKAFVSLVLGALLLFWGGFFGWRAAALPSRTGKREAAGRVVVGQVSAPASAGPGVERAALR